MDRIEIARALFAAYETGDRGAVEEHLAQDFTFSAPPDVGIDRATYFERCWPAAATTERFDFVRLLEADGDVIVTYEAARTDGTRFRNTEIFGFAGEKVASVEVYFGWNLTS